MSHALLQSFEFAQKKSIELLKSIYSQLKEGFVLSDIQSIIGSSALKIGSSGWLRPPLVRIFPKDTSIKKGSLIQIHIQPIFGDAFGSIGTTHAFQSEDTDIIEKARALCLATTTFANRWKCTGELFVFAQSWCTNHRVTLEHKKNIGHRCFSRSEIPLLWPQSARAMSMLRRHQVQWFNPRRFQGIFAVHPFISRHEQFAGFAELLYVEDENKSIIGRSCLEEIGSL